MIGSLGYTRTPFFDEKRDLENLKSLIDSIDRVALFLGDKVSEILVLHESNPEKIQEMICEFRAFLAITFIRGEKINIEEEAKILKSFCLTSKLSNNFDNVLIDYINSEYLEILPELEKLYRN